MNYEASEFDFCNSMLTAGEYVLWKGKPEKGHLFTRNDIAMIPFSIFWCGFAFVWFFGALAAGGAFALFGIPFILIGLYLVFGRFIYTSYRRKRTCYVVTNKKIIRKSIGKIDMLEIENLPAMRVEMHRDGCGTIFFGEYLRTHYTSRGHRTTSTECVFSMENIPDVIRVQELISNQ